MAKNTEELVQTTIEVSSPPPPGITPSWSSGKPSWAAGVDIRAVHACKNKNGSYFVDIDKI